MMRTNQIILIAALAVLLTGCASVKNTAKWVVGPKYSLAIADGSDPLKPTFVLASGLLFKGKAPYAHLQVQVRGADGRWSNVWFIGPRRSIEKPLVMKYGEMPENFDEYVRPAGLEVGREYRLLLAKGGYTPSIRFKIVEQGGRNALVRLGGSSVDSMGEGD